GTGLGAAGRVEIDSRESIAAGLVERGEAGAHRIDWKVHAPRIRAERGSQEGDARSCTAVIGYGLGGRGSHAPLVDAVAERDLAAVCTSRAAEVHDRYPDAAVMPAAEAIAAPGTALVVISTPNDRHFPLARAALEAGKHVVIDKPFANGVA